MKKTIVFCAILAVIQAEAQKVPLQYGGEIEIMAITGAKVLFGGSFAGSYSLPKKGVSDSYAGGTEAFIGPNISGDIILLFGGGLEYNFKYARERPYGLIRVVLPNVSLYGQYRLSQKNGYQSDFALGGTFHPGAGIFGIGVRYCADYDSKSLDLKLSFRFVGANTNQRITKSFCGGR